MSKWNPQKEAVTCEILLNQKETFYEETHWEKAAKTRMGKYLTSLETDFILSAIDPAKSNVIVDVGGEAGRFSLLAANRKVTVISVDNWLLQS